MEDVVRRGQESRLLNRGQRCRAVAVEIQVEMANRLNVIFRSSTGARFERIHSDIDVARILVVLVMQPVLEGGLRNTRGSCDPLYGLAALAISHQDGQPVRGMKARAEIFTSADFLAEWFFVAHACTSGF